MEIKRAFISAKKEKVAAIHEIVERTLYQHEIAKHIATMDLEDKMLRKGTRHVSRAKSIQFRNRHFDLVDKWRADYLPTVSSIENDLSTMQFKNDQKDNDDND